MNNEINPTENDIISALKFIEKFVFVLSVTYKLEFFFETMAYKRPNSIKCSEF